MPDDLLNLIKENRAEIEKELQGLEINASNRREIANRILPFLAQFNHDARAAQIIVFDTLMRMRTARALECLSKNLFDIKKSLEQLDKELSTPGKGSIKSVLKTIICGFFRKLDEIPEKISEETT